MREDGTAMQRWYRHWVRWVLRCYPRAWRARYAAEMDAVLQQHQVTLWTVLDLLCGVLDARLHADLLPGSVLALPQRIRTSEVAVFCAFVVYGCMWFGADYVRDPRSVWEAAVQQYPAIRVADLVMNGAGVLALCAMMVGGVPILFVVLRDAVRDRRWHTLALLATPLIALATLGAYALLAAGTWTQHAPHGTPAAPFTPLAAVLQVGFLFLLLAAVVGSTVAVAGAIGQTVLSTRLVRLLLVPATVSTLGMAIGVVATGALTALVLMEAPQLQVGSGGLQVAVTLMIGATALALLAVRQGWRAARQPIAQVS